MHRIQNTAMYKYANELNPIDYEVYYQIGTMNWYNELEVNNIYIL